MLYPHIGDILRRYSLEIRLSTEDPKLLYLDNYLVFFPRLVQGAHDNTFFQGIGHLHLNIHSLGNASIYLTIGPS